MRLATIVILTGSTASSYHNNCSSLQFCTASRCIFLKGKFQIGARGCCGKQQHHGAFWSVTPSFFLPAPPLPSPIFRKPKWTLMSKSFFQPWMMSWALLSWAIRPRPPLVQPLAKEHKMIKMKSRELYIFSNVNPSSSHLHPDERNAVLLRFLSAIA